MIRKLKSGWRIYSRKTDPKTGKRRNLGTFPTREAASCLGISLATAKRHWALARAWLFAALSDRKAAD